jgi:hypothetical protein
MAAADYLLIAPTLADTFDTPAAASPPFSFFFHAAATLSSFSIFAVSLFLLRFIFRVRRLAFAISIFILLSLSFISLSFFASDAVTLQISPFQRHGFTPPPLRRFRHRFRCVSPPSAAAIISIFDYCCFSLSYAEMIGADVTRLRALCHASAMPADRRCAALRVERASAAEACCSDARYAIAMQARAVLRATHMRAMREARMRMLLYPSLLAAAYKDIKKCAVSARHQHARWQQQRAHARSHQRAGA